MTLQELLDHPDFVLLYSHTQTRLYSVDFVGMMYATDRPDNERRGLHTLIENMTMEDLLERLPKVLDEWVLNPQKFIEGKQTCDEL